MVAPIRFNLNKLGATGELEAKFKEIFNDVAAPHMPNQTNDDDMNVLSQDTSKDELMHPINVISKNKPRRRW